MNGGLLVGGAPTGLDQGVGTVNITGNYYINGVPISTFIDAPSDGNIYGRQNAGWTSLGAGTGTVSDLSLTNRTSTQNTINNTGGDNVILLEATASVAGIMTTAQVTKLAGIADDANEYIHPAYTTRSINTSGAQVIDLFTSDAIGSVTNITTRNMTPADIGAASESDISVTSPAGDIQINSGIETLSIAGSNASGTVIRTTVGQMVFLSGRISWTSRTSSSSQIIITGLTYSSDYGTGVTASQKNLRITNSQRNGLSMELEAGASQFALYWMIGESDRITAKYQDMQTTGHIDINIQYFSSDVPQT